MKEFLAQEYVDREKVIREKNKMTEGFKSNVYQYARIIVKVEQINI